MKKKFLIFMILAGVWLCPAAACGETETHTHTLVYVAAAEATCTEEGNTAYWRCSFCGKYFSDESAETEISHSSVKLAALGHDYVGVTSKEATCTEAGIVTYTCSRCGGVYTEEIASLGHDYGEGVFLVEPTCTETGVAVYTCLVCGYVDTRTIAANGHSIFVDEAVAPTCTESGLTEGGHCLVCGEVFIEQEMVAPLGHNYEDGVCTRCGEAEPAQVQALSCPISFGETYGAAAEIGAGIGAELFLPPEDRRFSE